MSNTTNAKYHKCQWEEASSSIVPSANSPQMPGERPLSQTALQEIQQTPKRGLSPDGTTSKCPPANSPQLRYCGSRELFIPAAVHARMDLIIF